jgi:hypothetical protein
MAQHLSSDSFSCAAHGRVVRSHHRATPECKTALQTPIQGPFPFPTFGEIATESVADRIRLSLNWLDPDGEQSSDNPVVVALDERVVAYLKTNGKESYYCDRLPGLVSQDPYGIALAAIEPGLYFWIPEEIAAKRAEVPDYC